MDNFLAQAGSPGALDSEGSFLIDIRAASAKLAQQLPSLASWTLKVVQAVCRGSAKSLTIKQLKKGTHFQAKLCDFSLQEVQELLSKTELKSDTAEAHLAVALRSVGFGQLRSFRVALQEQDSLESLYWDGNQLSRNSSKELPSVPGHLEVWVETPKKDRKKIVLEEYSALVAACACSPIEVSCDNRRLDTLTPHNPTDAGMAVIANVWRSSEDSELPCLKLPPGINLTPKTPRWSDKFTDKRVFLLDGEATATSPDFIASLTYHYKIESWGEGENDSFRFRTRRVPSLVHWVIDGVVTHSQEIELEQTTAVRLNLYLAGDDLATDLTGLRPLENRDKAQRQRAGILRAAKSFGPTLSALQRHQVSVWEPNILPSLSFVVFHGLCMGIPTKGLTLPFHFLFLKAMVNGRVENKSKVRDDCLDKIVMLEEELEFWLQKNSESTSSPDQA